MLGYHHPRQKSASIVRTSVVALALAMLLSAAQWTRMRAQDSIDGPNFTRIEMGDVITDGGHRGASWVDFDNDGDLDLCLVGSSRGQRALYRNDGNDMFAKLAVEAFDNETGNALGNSWADYDNDGDLDVLIGGSSASSLFRNDGDGNFTKITTGDIANTDTRGWSPSWADFDQDGDVDLFITHPAGFVGPNPTSNHFFRNEGPPDYILTRIEDSAATAELAPFTIGNWSDFDQDGDLDLFVGSGPADGTTAPDFFYRNALTETGMAVLERITEGVFATDARDGQTPNWIDFDNDGDLDFYITNWGGPLGGLPNDLYRNDDGEITKIATGEIATDVAVSLANVWADLDNDGDLDVFVANGRGRGQLNRLYLNNGDGTFTPQSDGPVATDRFTNWGATAGDYDNDGDLDLFVPTLTVTRPNLLYRNDLDNGNHWIKIKCVGVVSNRAAIGAKVRIKATINGNAVWQIREISSQNSFLGHNSLNVHFGLGDAIVIETLIIEWPSGGTDELANVGVNQFIEISQGGALSVIGQ